MDKNEFRNLAQFLKEKYDAKRVFLFGSYAYGKSTPSSDLDICIITGHQNKRKIELLDRKSTRLNSSHIPLSRMPSSA